MKTMGKDLGTRGQVDAMDSGAQKGGGGGSFFAGGGRMLYGLRRPEFFGQKGVPAGSGKNSSESRVDVGARVREIRERYGADFELAARDRDPAVAPRGVDEGELSAFLDRLVERRWGRLAVAGEVARAVGCTVRAVGRDGRVLEWSRNEAGLRVSLDRRAKGGTGLRFWRFRKNFVGLLGSGGALS